MMHRLAALISADPDVVLEMKEHRWQGTALGCGVYGSTEGWNCGKGDHAAALEALRAAGAQR